MSTKEEIFNYVMETPGNTNPAVLKSMLDGIEGGSLRGIVPAEIINNTGEELIISLSFNYDIINNTLIGASGKYSVFEEDWTYDENEDTERIYYRCGFYFILQDEYFDNIYTITINGNLMEFGIGREWAYYSYDYEVNSVDEIPDKITIVINKKFITVPVVATGDTDQTLIPSEVSGYVGDTVTITTQITENINEYGLFYKETSSDSRANLTNTQSGPPLTFTFTMPAGVDTENGGQIEIYHGR